MVTKGIPFLGERAVVKKPHFYKGFCIFYEIGRGLVEAEYTLLRRILMKMGVFKGLLGHACF